jgi:hypothetical protein
VRSAAIDDIYRRIVRTGLPGPPVKSMREVEAGLVRQFKRRCHHFLADTPDQDDWLEWIALMQHYDAPTRFLDWTYSLYVGVFFAVERSDRECAVWAVDATWLPDEATRIFEERAGGRDPLRSDNNARTLAGFKDAFNMTPPLLFARPVNPYRLNERLSIQQGSFLLRGTSARRSRRISRPSFGAPRASACSSSRFPTTRTCAGVSFAQLHRMNVSRAILFPGLEGFAESLSTQLLIPQMLIADSGALP